MHFVGRIQKPVKLAHVVVDHAFLTKRAGSERFAGTRAAGRAAHAVGHIVRSRMPCRHANAFGAQPLLQFVAITRRNPAQARCTADQKRMTIGRALGSDGRDHRRPSSP